MSAAAHCAHGVWMFAHAPNIVPVQGVASTSQQAGGVSYSVNPGTAVPACRFFLQVLMQLAQAYLSCSQPKHVLDCISTMQGLSTGRTPLAGLLQLSSLALLQQGKLDAASAQLCAWLKQGGQGTAEACAAVRSFLLALHSCGPESAATNVQERAAAVQAVAAAAGELCRSDPAVALEVVMQLLAEEVRAAWR